MKKYIIKDIIDNTYYSLSDFYNWYEDPTIADQFDTKEEAENIIKDLDYGYYKIEEIYVVE